MLPPPDDDTNDDQDVTLDDDDTDVLADPNETCGEVVSTVRRPVNPPPAPVTGDPYFPFGQVEQKLQQITAKI